MKPDDDGMTNIKSQHIRLDNRVVIVTGASRGLGKSMAIALAETGARVVLTAPQTAPLEEVARAIAMTCGEGRAHVVAADITVPDDCDRILAEAIRVFGHVDVLINNARRMQRGPGIAKDAFHQRFWESDPKLWSEAVEVNINGMFTLTRIVAPHMIARGWGRIINITTSIDTMQRKKNSPYGVTKAAIDAATIIWAQDLEGSGVTANTLLPGGRVQADDDPREGPASRPGGDIPVTSMDRMAVWLSSEHSDGVTGQRFVGKRWNDALAPNDAAEGCREPPVLLTPAA